jgi:glycosyltransferase involved in cell wall biosynthesis
MRADLEGRHPIVYARVRSAWRLLPQRVRRQLVRAIDEAATGLQVTLGWLTFPVFIPAFLPRRSPRSVPAGTYPLVTMLAVSEVWRDPRVERGARALAERGYRVVIVYPDTSGEGAHSPLDWGPAIEFLALRAAEAAFTVRFPYVLGLGLLRAAIPTRPFAFHAHDLATSLVALTAAWLARAHCVCDFHEWYSENVTWNTAKQTYEPHTAPTRIIYRMLERLCLRKASAVITVCESLAAELEAMSGYRRKVDLVRNVPAVTDAGARARPRLADQLGGPGRFVLLYQGGVGPSRLLEPVIRAIAKTPEVLFVIRGPGIDRYGPAYLRLAESCGVANRVFCLAPVPSSDVVAEAACADAGLWTLPHLCRNFYFALPNKIFEYLAAGLPLLVAGYPEARRIVLNHGVGFCFDPYDPDSIAEQINRLAGDPALCERLRGAIPLALQKLSVQDEWQKLVRLYDRLRMSPV